jgi:hypothetical protein
MIYNNLTYGVVNGQLQNAINNACLYGVDVISKLNQGIPCKKEKKRAQKIMDLVDSIYGPYGTVIPNTPASVTYSTALWSGGSSSFALQLDITLPLGVNTFTTPSESTILGAITNIVSQVNTFFGSQVCIYDSANKQFIMFDPANSGAAANGLGIIQWSSSGTGSPYINPTSGNFSGGITGNANTTFVDTNTCMKTNNIETILDELTKLGVLPCTTIENF